MTAMTTMTMILIHANMQRMHRMQRTQRMQGMHVQFGVCTLPNSIAGQLVKAVADHRVKNKNCDNY